MLAGTASFKFFGVTKVSVLVPSVTSAVVARRTMPAVVSEAAPGAAGIVGRFVRSVYEPEVATVAKVGLLVMSAQVDVPPAGASLHAAA